MGAESAERAVQSLWLWSWGYGLCFTLWTESYLQGKGEVQWLQQQETQMLKHRNQSCYAMTLGEGNPERLGKLSPWHVGPSRVFTGILILSESTGLSGAEEAELETIKKHKQELLDDIKVRTTLSLEPSQVCLHQGASLHSSPGHAEVLLHWRHLLCHDPTSVLNFRCPGLFATRVHSACGTLCFRNHQLP